MMRQHKTVAERQKESLALAALVTGYIALACGLKLDGYVSFSWTLILSPVWFPIAAAVTLTALWAVVLLTAALIQKIIDYFNGTL